MKHDDAYIGAPAWQSVNLSLSALGITPNVAHRVALLSTVIGLLQAGMGVAILPRMAQRQMPKGIKRLPIVEPPLQWPIATYRRANYPLTPAAKALLATVRSVLKSEKE